MIEHLNHGQLTLPIAFGISMTGSALGLLLARHARRQETPLRRIPWLIGAAFAIGGTGVWVMHFVAMLDFAVRGAVILYDPWTTALSALLAVAVVACGLFMIGLGRYTRAKLAGAGIVTGLGIATMHYMGMAAVRSDIELLHRTEYVLAAGIIAIIAATTALWLAWRLQRAIAMWLGAIVMALAVNLMHYTAMFGLEVGEKVSGILDGTSATSLIIPMGTLTAIVLIILVFMVVIIPTEKELLAEQALISSIERANHVPAPATQPHRPSPFRTNGHR